MCTFLSPSVCYFLMYRFFFCCEHCSVFRAGGGGEGWGRREDPGAAAAAAGLAGAHVDARGGGGGSRATGGCGRTFHHRATWGAPGARTGPGTGGVHGVSPSPRGARGSDHCPGSGCVGGGEFAGGQTGFKSPAAGAGEESVQSDSVEAA